MAAWLEVSSVKAGTEGQEKQGTAAPGLVPGGLAWCWRKTKAVRQREKHNDFNL